MEGEYFRVSQNCDILAGHLHTYLLQLSSPSRKYRSGVAQALRREWDDPPAQHVTSIRDGGLAPLRYGIHEIRHLVARGQFARNPFMQLQLKALTTNASQWAFGTP